MLPDPFIFESSLDPPTPSIPNFTSQTTQPTLQRSKQTHCKAFSAFSLCGADAIYDDPPNKRRRFAPTAELTDTSDVEIDAPGNDPP